VILWYNDMQIVRVQNRGGQFLVGCPLSLRSQQTESFDKGENLGQFDLHRHLLDWFRDNFYFAPVSAEDKGQKQRSGGTQESLSDLA
jgi:hypothetical protein